MDDYDEYGNYLGEALAEDEEEEHHDDAVSDEEEEEVRRQTSATQSSSSAIVLHEDKAIYPSASSVFGDDVEIVMDEGPAHDKSKPLLPKEELVKEKRQRRKPLIETEDDRFENFLISNPATSRIIAVIGHLHHGKSSIVRMLHRKSNSADAEAKSAKTVNVREDESKLKVSIKARPVSSACADSTGKSYYVQTIDTPGHVNFADEVESALEIADGAILCVDAVEGVQFGTEHCVQALKRYGLLDSVVVIITKCDRLIHELKLLPTDAHRKLVHVIEQLDGLFERFGSEREIVPNRGRVLFSSALHGWSFSLESMAKLTASKSSSKDDIIKLTDLLWGEVYYHPETRQFSQKRTSQEQKRTFEYFCLDPIYKMYSHVLGGESTSLSETLQMKLTLKEQSLDALPLLKRVLSKLMGLGATQIVDSIVLHIDNPVDGAKYRLRTSWRGSVKSDLGKQICAPEADGPLLLNCVKFISPLDDDNDMLDLEEEESFSFSTDVAFRVLARVYSGTLNVGDQVVIREPSLYQDGDDEDEDGGKHAAEEDEENAVKAQIRSIRLPSRGSGKPCRLVHSAFPGTIVLLSGIDSHFAKSSTITSRQSNPPVAMFHPLKLLRLAKTKPVMKLAIEPLIPSELPKMLTGLRACQKSYPTLQVHVEASGEYVLFGTGELYLDSVMRDLREKYCKGTEIKVVDPFVALRETCRDQSATRCIGKTSNDKNSLSIIAAPMENQLIEDLESGFFAKKISSAPSLESVLRKEFSYDIVSARSVWAFGPSSSQGPNMIMDYLDDDDEEGALAKKDAQTVRDPIVQGFKWACREGPLCGEPIRGVKLKLFDCSLAADERDRVPGQIIKTTKKISHQALLKASPALYEPYYAFDAILTDSRATNLVRNAVQKRRGFWTTDRAHVTPIPGTPLMRFRAHIPVLDSFGLETEIRLKSQGRVYCQMYFDQWKLCPGDPLDDTLVLKPLEPSPADFLARDLVLKTRRRKGLPEHIESASEIDQQLLRALAAGKTLSE